MDESRRIVALYEDRGICYLDAMAPQFGERIINICGYPMD